MPKAAKPSTRRRNANNKAPLKNSKTSEITVDSPSSAANKSQSTAGAPQAAPTTPSDEPNYLIMVDMILSSNPTITRILSVPPTLTFSNLHQVLQIAFGWTNSHMHTFDVNIPVFPAAYPYRALHLLSACNMDSYLPDTMNVVDEAKWSLKDVFDKKVWEVKDHPNSDEEGPTRVEVREGEVQISYEYDMGDSWEHQITLLGRTAQRLHSALGAEEGCRVLCLGGEGHPCAEDCGSEPGWEQLKAAFKKARGDAELKNWYKTMCSNGDKKGLDPYKWDILGVNMELQKLDL